MTTQRNTDEGLSPEQVERVALLRAAYERLRQDPGEQAAMRRAKQAFPIGLDDAGAPLPVDPDEPGRQD